MAGFRIEGDTSGNVAEVTAANGLKVSSPSALDSLGNPVNPGNYVNTVCEADAGLSTGSVLQRQVDISANYRMNVGIDTLLFNDFFNGAAVNTTLWSSTLVTFVNAVSNGFLVLNSTSLTTVNAVSRVSSYRGFPAYGTYPLQIDIEAVYAAASVMPNTTTELGFGFATTTTAPTDGAFFRYNSAGEFRCVVNYNGAESQSAALTAPSVSVRHHYIIVIGSDYVEFWVDNILQANLAIPTGSGMALLNDNPPVLIRHYNAAVAPSSAVQIKIAQVSISIGDMCTSKPWEVLQAGMGGVAAQGQTGQTLGTTARTPASGAAPTAAVPTNTTAALGTGLGGDFLSTNTLAINTYGIISSFQVPAATAASLVKTLYLTGIRIDTTVQATLANAAAANYVWGIAFGHTAVSLATAEAATTKAPRIIVLGQQAAIGALTAGSQLPSIDFNFGAIAVQPGEFVQSIMKNGGTVGTGGTLYHTISFRGFWE